MICKFGYYESFRNDNEGGRIEWRGVTMLNPHKDFYPCESGYSWVFANSEKDLIAKMKKEVKGILRDCIAALDSLA